jgi:hypothetical protein
MNREDAVRLIPSWKPFIHTLKALFSFLVLLSRPPTLPSVRLSPNSLLVTLIRARSVILSVFLSFCTRQAVTPAPCFFYWLRRLCPILIFSTGSPEALPWLTCSFVSWPTSRPAHFTSRHDDGGRTDLWNTCKLIPAYAALQPRRQQLCSCILFTVLQHAMYTRSAVHS